MKNFYKILCVLLLLVGFPAISDELSYTRDSAKKYMENSENSYLVLKVRGYVSSASFFEEIESYLGKDLTRKALKEIPQNREEFFIVLKSYKGSFKPGDVIQTMAMDSHPVSAEIGQKYIIMLSENVSPLAYPGVQLVYDQCGLFNVQNIPGSTLSNFDKVVAYLLENGKAPCLWRIHYTEEN